MAIETTPNADAADKNENFLDQFHSFELGIPLSDHETIDDTGNVIEENDPQEVETPEVEVETTEPSLPPEEAIATEGDQITGDERVEVLFELMRNGQFLTEDDKFDPTVDNLPKVMDKVAINLFEGYVQSMPDVARDLIVYLSKQDQNFGLDQARQFFDQYIEPVETFKVPTNDEEAMSYLQTKFTKEKVFPSDDDLQDYLDRLLEKGKLLEVAKPKAEEDYQLFETSKQQAIAQAQQTNEQRLQYQRDYYDSIFKSIDEEPWNAERKVAVRQAVDPKKVTRLNGAIQKSPKAVAQLALLYSFYDEQTNEFDLSSFGEAAEGKKVAKKKDTMTRQSHEAIISKLGNKSANKDAANTGFFESFQPATK